MKKNISIGICILFILIFFSTETFPWSKETHVMVSFKTNLYFTKLKDQSFLLKLNFDKGVMDQQLLDDDISKSIMDWLMFGSDKEDDSLDLFGLIGARSENHFHNPLKPFSIAGLSDVKLGESSILWAQDGKYQNIYVQGDNSWTKLREFYFSALTSTENTIKQSLFANTFKGLGHQIHLIQDSAVPDHVRNDSHPLNNFAFTNEKYGNFRCIESWAESSLTLISDFTQVPLFPQVNLKQVQENNLVPILNLVDYDVYTGSNPSNLMEQGLAEYTNANFVSEDTILTEGNNPDSLHYFPYPKYASTNLNSLNMPYIITAADGKQDYVTYLKKDKDGEIIEHFLKAGYMEKELRRNLEDPPTEIYLRTFFLDELCHKDYASMLIPRAVGYSAKLIDYFFRGEIEVTLPVSNPGIDPPQMEGIYSLCTDPAVGFEKLSLMVRNITANDEEMKNGKITLVVSYRNCNGNPFVPNPPLLAEERKYISVEYQGEVTIPRDNPMRINFNLSEHPLPFDAVDVTLTVVFKGDLGAELTDAVAIGFKDISEPTPIDFFNNTDKICFNGNYVNYDDTALWDFVDVNPKNGKIDCLNNAEIDITRKRIGQEILPIYISFNGKPACSTNYFYKCESGWEILPGETPNRFFVLTDPEPAISKYSILVHAKSIENPDDCLSYYDYTIIHPLYPYKNKLDWNGQYNHNYSLIDTFRGFPHWNILIFQNTSIPEGSKCSLSQFKNNASANIPQISSVFLIKKSE